MSKHPIHTEKYKHFNHHHELDDQHQLVDFGDGEFIANNKAIPLLKALNEAGLKTRSHHIDGKTNWVTILLGNVNLNVRKVNERDSTRDKYDGKYEILLDWQV